MAAYTLTTHAYTLTNTMACGWGTSRVQGYLPHHPPHTGVHHGKACQCTNHENQLGTNQPTNQSTRQPTNQATKQPTTRVPLHRRTNSRTDRNQVAARTLDIRPCPHTLISSPAMSSHPPAMLPHLPAMPPHLDQPGHAPPP